MHLRNWHIILAGHTNAYVHTSVCDHVECRITCHVYISSAHKWEKGHLPSVFLMTVVPGYFHIWYTAVTRSVANSYRLLQTYLIINSCHTFYRLNGIQNAEYRTGTQAAAECQSWHMCSLFHRKSVTRSAYVNFFLQYNKANISNVTMFISAEVPLIRSSFYK